MNITKENAIQGYKVFDADWKCKEFQCKVGETYEHKGTVEKCSSGFHFCKKLEDCFKYYPSVTWNHVAKVRGWGEISECIYDSKLAVSHIEILREIEFKDIATAYDSIGVYDSRGVAASRGVATSRGVAFEIFPPKKEKVFKIFGKGVEEQRFYEVMGKIKKLWGDWQPQANNAFKLYDQYGKEWEKTPCDRIRGNGKLDWSEMPQTALEYIRALPEFDAVIFKNITGITEKI